MDFIVGVLAGDRDAGPVYLGLASEATGKGVLAPVSLGVPLALDASRWYY